MKLVKPASIALAALLIAACSPSKKSTRSTASTSPATPVAPAPATAPNVGPSLPSSAVSKSGVFAPGNDELAAIQAKHSDVTMKTLTDGYAIYVGVCTNCHGAKSIYNRPEEKWQGIIDDMAPKALLSNTQKDAVYKYVMAIKATQPKAGK